MVKARKAVEEFSKADEMVVDEVVGNNAAPKRKRKSSKKSGSVSKFPLWGGELNWRNVTPAADSLSLLVGSEEGGFLSLEEIDGDSWQPLGSEFGGENTSLEVADDSEKLTDRVCRSKRKRRKKNNAEDKSVASFLGLPLSEDSSGSVCVQEEIAGTNPLKQQQKRGRKKKQQKEKVKQVHESCRPMHLEEEDLDVSHTPSYIKDVKEQFSPVESAQKVKKPRLGSRARRLLRGNDVVGQDDEKSESAEQANGPSEIFGVVPVEEQIDMSPWAQMRLHPKLEKAISELKFREPTAIQRECIPPAAHKGKDVIGAAETGSGKTLAFGLPILQRLLEEQDKASRQDISEESKEDKSTGRCGALRALIISPTRELAMQICQHLKAVAKWTTIRMVPIVGGMATQKQQRLLKHRPEIVVGTPGRLWELMSGGEKHLSELQWLSFFVLDEADRMVEKGHFRELQSIIDMLPTMQSPNSEELNGDADSQNNGLGVENVDTQKPKKRRQTLVFSASLALPADFKSKLRRVHKMPGTAFKSVDTVAALSQRAGVNHEAAVIDLTSSSIVAEKLTESIVECRDEEKDQYLYYILKVHGVGRTIVFCTSISALRRASAILRLLQIPVWPLHAQMQQKARLKAMDRFRGTEDCVLVATDVAARGLDIPGIRTVIHYQLPHSAEIYVHRSGRTARASTDGISIALVSPADRPKYLTLCRALSRPEGLRPFPVNMTYMPAIEKRILLAVKVDKFLRKQSQSKAAEVWLARHAEALEIDMEVSEDEDGVLSKISHKNNSLSKGDSCQLKLLQKELQETLRQPVKPKAFSNRYITGGGMTPLVTKQLQDYINAKSVPGGGKPAMGKGKLVVIGQEQIEPLEALRLSAPITSVKRKRY